MTRKEFQRVFQAAKDGIGRMEESDSLVGIGCHKDRVACTVGGCASFIRYQCHRFDGTWDTEELTRTQEYFKRVNLVD